MDYEKSSEIILDANSETLHEFLVTKEDDLIDILFEWFILS